VCVCSISFQQFLLTSQQFFTNLFVIIIYTSITYNIHTHFKTKTIMMFSFSYQVIKRTQLLNLRKATFHKTSMACLFQ